MAWKETFDRVEKAFRAAITGNSLDGWPTIRDKIGEVLDRGIADIDKIEVEETTPMPYGMKATLNIKVLGQDNPATAVAFFPATAGGMEFSEGRVTYNLRDHPDHYVELWIPVACVDIPTGTRGPPESMLEVIALNEESGIPIKVASLPANKISATHWVVREQLADVFKFLEKDHGLEHKRQHHYVLNPGSRVAVGAFIPQPYGMEPTRLMKTLLYNDVGRHFKR